MQEYREKVIKIIIQYREILTDRDIENLLVSSGYYDDEYDETRHTVARLVYLEAELRDYQERVEMEEHDR